MKTSRRNLTLSIVNLFGLLILLIGSAAFPSTAFAFSNTIQVTTTADNLLPDGQCSLRKAITNTNDNAATYPECIYGAGPLVIAFATGPGTATIVLTSALPDITHTTGLTIDGGSRITISGNNAFRVFRVIGGATLTLTNLSVTGGRAISFGTSADDGFGGGVRNAGTLTITNCTFSNNSATLNSGFGGSGGGVYNIGSASITNSRFSINTAATYGGGVANSQGGTTTITGSTFLSNAANGGYGGGAVFNFGTLAIANSTLAGNSGAGVNGGGLYNHTGIATLTNNTFSANSAVIGGDIYNSNSPAAATLNLYNTILANSLGGGDCVNNSGTVTGNNNLIEATGSNACGLVHLTNGNIVGLDPSLAPLYTSAYFPLLPASLAINAGDDAKCLASPVSNTSQNGLARPQGAHCDIGSYEGDFTPPVVISSVRADPDPTSASSIRFTVTFSESVSGVAAADFSLTTTGSISGASVASAIGSGTVATVTVNAGSGTGTIRLNVLDNDSIVDAYSNPLGGVGLGNGNFTAGESYSVSRVPVVSLSPTSLSFGDQHIATTSAAQTITLTNTGTGPLTITTIARSDSAFAPATNCGLSLAAGAYCKLNVTFTPVAAGNLVGSISVTDNASGSPHSVTVSGVGVANNVPICTLTANPVSIRRSGTSILTPTCTPAATSYAWTGGTCQGTTASTCDVTPAATTTYDVTGTNSYGSSGPVSATVTVKAVDLTPILMLLLD